MNNNIPLNIGNNAQVPAEMNYPKMNFFQRVLGVIFSPGKTMQSLAQKPRILFGLLLTLLTPVVMIFAIFPMFLEYTRGTFETLYPNFTAEQIDQGVNIAAVSGPIGGAIGAVAMWFLGALALWVIIKIFKGQGQYKQVLSILGYAAVISALAANVTILATQLTGVYSDVSYTSLASLIPNMKGSFIFGVARSIDIFSIWKYVVIAIGVFSVSKLEKKKVYIIVACIFAALAIYTGIGEVSTAALF